MNAIVATIFLALAAQAASEPPVSAVRHQQPDGNHVLIHEVVVDAPRADVWRAVSTAEGWKQWAVPVAWVPAGRPDVIETSYTREARPGDASTIQQKVLLRLCERLIIFRTVKAPSRFPDFDTFTNVLSILELEPLGQRRTRVRLIGSPYPDTAAGKRLLGFFERGNRMSLDKLRARFALDSGRTGYPSD